MIPLNALTFPLKQNALIEASAGTGKTYTISNLYLRLVIGDECQPLSVAQILILTFTNAATAELKERILARIQEALRDFTLGESRDSFIAELFYKVSDPEAAIQRLRLAAQEMDVASVFTIHGFCQRVLTEHAFESGSEWQSTMLLDDSDLIDMAVKDYWRTNVARLPKDVLEAFLNLWPSPDNLVRALRPVIFRDIGNESPQALKTQYLSVKQQYLQKTREAQQWWRENAVSQMLAEADLKANVKLAKAPFLQMMESFSEDVIAESGLLSALGKDGWLTLVPEKVVKARKKSSAVLPIAEFERFTVLHKLQGELTTAQQLAFFWEALVFVRRHLARSKASRSQLAPDDLLQNLRQALEAEPGDSLARAIKKQYPVTLIDEFQDTDEVQFAIFRDVYLQGTDTASLQGVPDFSSLILIGDPKQAIYSFRGGDIYTYLHAKHLIAPDALYTLDTNWRSNPGLIQAINQLFARSEAGFMNADMPFYPVKTGRGEKRVETKGAPVNAIKFSVLPSRLRLKGGFEPLKWAESSTSMSRICANEVAATLQSVKVDGNPIKANDICILVRDRFEADLVQTALREYQIDSVFLLKETVFKSRVAFSLYLLLRAVLEHKKEASIKAALLDWMMCFNQSKLQTLIQETAGWQRVLNHFHHAWQLLLTKSVMTALDYLLSQFNVFARLAGCYSDSDRIITDIRHLSEILQKQSTRMEGAPALLKWYAQRVADPELIKADNIEDIQWRLETDQNLVQITTIHASKGLQYPFVFIPFVSRYKASDSGFYHDDTQQLNYSLVADEAIQQQMDNERLSEDIRLFYVAVTRAVYHCWLGVWDNNIAGRKVQSGFRQTALGRLIHFPEMVNCDHHAIRQRLQSLLSGTSGTVNIVEEEAIEAFNLAPQVPTEGTDLRFGAALLDKNIEQSWFLTSYSAISKQRVLPDSDLHAEESFKAGDELAVSEDSFITRELAADVSVAPLDAQEMRFRFARGAGPGSYLHEVLEIADFSDKNDLLVKCQELADKFSIAKEDTNEVADWLWEVLMAPLTDIRVQGERPKACCLQDLSDAQRLPEMEFWLPLHQVDITEFNRLVQSWVPGDGGEYRLQTLHGMLKGFLDLVYTFDGQFYVADYKSNYLGDHYADYHYDALHEAMIHHDYYLQALLYSLALHRFLKLKLPNYSYEKYIGGGQYLFLRGMSASHPGSGVLQVKPPKSLILALDRLFQEQDPHQDRESQTE